jgi:hypothetical protein
VAYVAEARLRWGEGWIEPGCPVPSNEGRRYDHLLAAGLISGTADPPGPARVVVPYTELEQETVDALVGRDVEFVDVSGSDTAYWELLNGLWGRGEDFAIVEQDIVVNSFTLTDFDQCPSIYCVSPYPYLRSPAYPGLGCARFRSGLMYRVPQLMAAVATYDFENHSPKHWCTIDAAMLRELWSRRYFSCQHRTVRHLGDGRPSHKCCGMD